MDATRAFVSLGIAMGLGLLVGLQREREDSAIAGVRTFPLITMLGVLCAMIGDLGASWAVPAGFLVVGGTMAIGNWLRERSQKNLGITTEVAIALMFAVGALLWLAPGAREVPVAVGAACAVLLYLKQPLHGLVKRFTDTEVRAIMQFAAISLVVLPVIPDRDMGPLDSINPREVWLLVVLVVGISLVGYIVFKILPERWKRASSIASGLLGGLVSSTATTASVARRVRTGPCAVNAGAAAIAIAWTILFVRVVVEIAVAAPSAAGSMVVQVVIMGLGAGAGGAVLWAASRKETDPVPEPQNPTELRSALLFAAVYAAVLPLVAVARQWMGSGGLYAVAVVMGLTDLDAITLSTSRLVQSRHLTDDVAWRAIVLALLSNTMFKLTLGYALGGRVLFRKLAIPTGIVVVTGVALLMLWPTRFG
jgi:uncharacterized membrane protein (DUF4010 family)